MEPSTAAPSGSTGSTTIADMAALAAERFGDERRSVTRAAANGATSPSPSSARSVSSRPRADRPRPAGGRPRRAAVHHAARVDLRGLRDHERRRRRGPDLPDELPVGVRVGGRQLRVALHRLRGRLPGGQDRRGARRAARAGGDHRDRAVATARSRSTTCAARPRARPAEVAERAAAVKPEDPYTFIYTSGTTGPPKGCVLSHGNTGRAQHVRGARALESDEIVYLYLPLAHSYALLIQLLAIDLGTTIAYFGGDTKQIVAELNEVQPSYLPSVPRIFEKIYTLVTSNGDPEQIKAATQVGLKVRRSRRPASRSPPSSSSTSTQPRRSCSRTSARRSAASSSRPTPAPPRSPRRSSSSSTRAACPCSRATA